MAAKRRRIRNPESKQDFFRNLPLEITTEILSRLGIQTIMRCKCVCKSWLNLFKSVEFGKSHSHVSRSVPGLGLDRLALALYQGTKGSEQYKVVEVVDAQNSVEKDCNTLFNFDLPRKKLLLHSSVNGLLFLLNKYEESFFICNPITRELVELPPPLFPAPPLFPPQDDDKDLFQENSFGFGVSKLTGKYKVVRMFHNCEDTLLPGEDYSEVREACRCEVYTLGTGSWRSIYVDEPFMYDEDNLGVFLNGNLHWLVGIDPSGLESVKISYFDLETECFSTFSVPPFDTCWERERSMGVLGDSLCLCDNFERKVVIWVMKDYGDDKSWAKEFVIKKSRDRYLVDRFKLARPVVPIKIFNDGDVLFARELSPKLYLYSSKTGRVEELRLTASFAKLGFRPSIYTPSLLPLKTFAMENVTSF